MSRRTEKVGDLLQAEIADLLHRNVKHPALLDAIISITRVVVSADFSRARVHVSVMIPEGEGEGEGEGDADQDEATVIEALERTEPYLHRELVSRLRMRRVPRLRFIADRSIAEGDRMSAMLRGVARSEGRES